MRQRLGQHFLHDAGILRRIATIAELGPEKTLLEIGPGKGALTQHLIGKCRRLVAIELDDALAADLPRRIPHPALEVRHMDILQADLDALFPDADRPIRVLGNLPYAITSPIFEKLMPWPGWDVAVFLVQREVAERICSDAGSKAYGLLTLAVQLYAETELIMCVSPGAFIPPPDVQSAVLRLRRKPSLNKPPDWIFNFFDLARGAFAHRRKTIANSLAFYTGVARKDVETWLAEERVAPSARAESLTLADYARLSAPWAIFRREMKLTTLPATSTIPNTLKKKPS